MQKFRCKTTGCIVTVGDEEAEHFRASRDYEAIVPEPKPVAKKPAAKKAPAKKTASRPRKSPARKPE